MDECVCVCVSLQNEIIHVSSNRFVFSFRLFLYFFVSLFPFRSLSFVTRSLGFFCCRIPFCKVLLTSRLESTTLSERKEGNWMSHSNRLRFSSYHNCNIWWGMMGDTSHTIERDSRAEKLVQEIHWFSFRLIFLSLWRATAPLLIDWCCHCCRVVHSALHWRSIA